MKFLQRIFASIICTLFVFLGTWQSGVSADPPKQDTYKGGGSYRSVFSSQRKYRLEQSRAFAKKRSDERKRGQIHNRKARTSNPKKYECHHLISRRALNNWAAHIRRLYEAGRLDDENYFKIYRLLHSKTQWWVPSIALEKKDHEKTSSYYNRVTRTKEQNAEAIKYINNQTETLVRTGDIEKLLKEEIEAIEKWGSKYKKAIKQVKKYIGQLKISRDEDKGLICIEVTCRSRHFKVCLPFGSKHFKFCESP